MKKSPLRPGTKGLERRTRLKSAPPRATGRPSKRFADRRDPEYCAYIRTLPCAAGGSNPAACRLNDRFMAKGETPPQLSQPWLILFGVKDCSGPIECAHVVSRGAGGGDRGNTVSLCRTHHRQQHAKGILSFQTLYSLDLAAIATQLAVRAPVRSGTPTEPA